MGADAFALLLAAINKRPITANRNAGPALMSEFPASPHASEPHELWVDVTLMCNRHAIEAGGAKMPNERCDARLFLVINAADSVVREPREASCRALGVAELYEACGLWRQLEGNDHGYDILLNLVDRIAPLDFRAKVAAIGGGKIRYDKQQVGMPALILAHECA